MIWIVIFTFIVCCIVFDQIARPKATAEPKEHDYICTRDAISMCDQPKEVCCFCCEERDDCNSWHCDEYDSYEYGYQCPYSEWKCLIDEEEVKKDA